MKAIWNKIVELWNESLVTIRNLELLLEAVALIYVSAFALSNGKVNPLGKQALTAFGLLIVLRGSYEFLRFVRAAKLEV